MTLIDTEYVNVLHFLLRSTIFLNDMSDHFPLLIEFSGTHNFPRSVNNQLYRHYDSTSITHFSNLLECQDWSSFNFWCPTESDFSILYDNFLKCVTDIYNIALPEIAERIQIKNIFTSLDVQSV